MSPPAVIGSVVRPVIFIIEFKEAPVRAVRGHISALAVTRGILIYSFPVKPFIEGTAVIKDTVKDDLYVPSVALRYKGCK